MKCLVSLKPLGKQERCLLRFRSLETPAHEVLFCATFSNVTTASQTWMPWGGREKQIFYTEECYWLVTVRVQNWKTLKLMSMKSFLQYHLIYLALNQYLSSLLGDCMMGSFLSSPKDRSNRRKPGAPPVSNLSSRRALPEDLQGPTRLLKLHPKIEFWFLFY